MAFLAAMAVSLTACSNDDEPEGTIQPSPEEGIENDMSQLTAPAFANESGKYSLAANNEGIRSIEITESGMYHIEYGYAYPSSYSTESTMERKSLVDGIRATLTSVFSSPRQTPVTRYGSGVSIGKVIKIGEGEYILEGYGTITVSGDSENAIEIILNPENGNSVTVGAQKEATYSLNDAATVALCRSWAPTALHLRADLNGVTVADQSGPYTDLINIRNRAMAQIIAALKSKYGQYFDEEDFELEPEEGEVYYPTLVLFSRSGSYLVEYENDYLDVRQWKWLDIARQTMHWSHDLDNPYDENSSDSDIKFSGKNVIIHSANSIVDGDEEEGIYITITSHTWETMTEI